MTKEVRELQIQKIAEFPAKLRQIVGRFTPALLQLNCPPSHPTLDGDWTLAQTIHHIADSHINSYTRMKFILTENRPTIKTWAQQSWAELPDAKELDVEDSVAILVALHKRWVNLLTNLQDSDFDRVGNHPVTGEITIADLLETYSRHGEDHLEQIELLLAQNQN
ncbi:DinB family protein [Brevibacillus ginsengisoli]|uniref:DinB family protein n=1 Tax=Brevibacillus ginsengisoli TaxID=363854 RepID=UPI003CF5D0EC